MFNIDDDRSITELRDEDPEALLVAVAMVTAGEQIGVPEVLELARALATEEINLFRMMQEHPETTAESFGLEQEIPDSLVEKIDDVIETVG